MKLTMMKGLPASGKSTYAKELIERENYKRVNRDDLRAMIDNGQWDKRKEEMVVFAEKTLAKHYLLAGYNVVVDDTNLAPKNETMWQDIAIKAGAEFEVKDFTDVDVELCIRRDSERAKSVGKKVIMQMYNQFLKKDKPIKRIKLDAELPNCFIFDIDGTLAIKGNRSPYEWAKVGEDTPNKAVVATQMYLWEMTKNKFVDTKIFIFSGRDGSCAVETSKWLERMGVEHDGLFMREAGNMEKDAIIKERMYRKFIEGKYNVLGIFDDRDQVVEMWRSLGLPCYQVAPGDF